MRIENIVRKVLNLNLLVNYRGQDIRNLIENELKRDTLINQAWDILTRNVKNRKLADVTKNQIIQNKGRHTARSYVNCYVQTMKRKLSKLTLEKKASSSIQLSKKAEPAMRKTLT